MCHKAIHHSQQQLADVAMGPKPKGCSRSFHVPHAGESLHDFLLASMLLGGLCS
jgi:hypothetical protein